VYNKLLFRLLSQAGSPLYSRTCIQFAFFIFLSRFCTCQPSLLSNGYRGSFPGVQRPEHEIYH